MARDAGLQDVLERCLEALRLPSGLGGAAVVNDQGAVLARAEASWSSGEVPGGEVPGGVRPNGAGQSGWLSGELLTGALALGHAWDELLSVVPGQGAAAMAIAFEDASMLMLPLAAHGAPGFVAVFSGSPGSAARLEFLAASASSRSADPQDPDQQDPDPQDPDPQDRALVRELSRFLPQLAKAVFP